MGFGRLVDENKQKIYINHFPKDRYPTVTHTHIRKPLVFFWSIKIFIMMIFLLSCKLKLVLILIFFFIFLWWNMAMCLLWRILLLVPLITSPVFFLFLLTSFLSLYIFQISPSFLYIIYISWFVLYIDFVKKLLTPTLLDSASFCDKKKFQWKAWLSEHRDRPSSALFQVSTAVLTDDL